MALESSPEQPQPLRTVAQAVKGWIERLGWVWVSGQIIEINRRAGARTVFVTLRDKLAEVSVSLTMSPLVLDTAGPLSAGTEVVAHLRPSYYAASGRLSFHCDDLRIVGEGQLLARLEQRKRMLQAEGLFDPRRKKRLPFLPRAVGLVTAAGSAAERDVVTNATRRWPRVTIITAHAPVQGPQAVEQLLPAIERLDRDDRVDVIVIARGGGSLEDLLPFSDEALVRAVAACRTPVVSAIGHEQDMPILDLVADLRASTPTDAAKRIVPDAAEERDRVDVARARLRAAIDGYLRRQRESLAAIRSRPVLADPTATFAVHHDQLAMLRRRADRAIAARLDRESTAIEHLLARTRAMSPRATLERGYAIVVDGAGRAVTGVAGLRAGAEAMAYLRDGRVDLTVAAVHPAAARPTPKAAVADPSTEQES